MAFTAAPAPTTDNATTGPLFGKAFNTHSCTFALVNLKMQGAPAPFNLQKPPKTMGRPL